MYEAFFGLNEKPFNLTPDPRFLYLSDKHKEAFAHLLFGIRNRCGFVMVTGEVGTGKTTICRSLLNQLDPDTEVAFIFNPCLSPEELLQKINEDFGIDSRAKTIKELIDELNVYLLERTSQGKNCVLMIDEAQNLRPTVLEQIRLLSNLETETQKLLQIVLVGQPELAHMLQLPELRQLNQRITARYHLKPLNSGETVQYIAYRLRVAGGRKKVRFTRGALRAVFRFSEGTPRVINAICDRALLIGYTREQRDITARLLKVAAHEIKGEVIRKKIPFRVVLQSFLPNPSLLVTAVLMALLVGLILFPFRNAGAPSWYEGPPAPAARAPDANNAPAAPSNQVVATVQLPAPHPEAVPVSISHPEPAPAPPPAPPKPATVPLRQFAKTDPATARRCAMTGVLHAWDHLMIGAPENETVECLEQFAISSGLAAESLSLTLDELLAINLPALCEVQVGGKSLWIGLVGVADDAVRITAEGKDAETVDTALVARNEFRDAFTHLAVICWKDPKPDTHILRKLATGPEVETLQQSLRMIGRLIGEKPGIYDDKTARAVAKIQAETGLAIDGITGKQVRMILSSWRPDSTTPTLVPRPSNGTVPEIQAAAPAAPTDKAAAKPAPDALRAGKTEKEPGIHAKEPRDFGGDQPLPVFSLEPPGANTDTIKMLPLDAARVMVEELPAPLRDALAPQSTPPVKEVTPPAISNAPLTPHEPHEANTGNMHPL